MILKKNTERSVVDILFIIYKMYVLDEKRKEKKNMLCLTNILYSSNFLEKNESDDSMLKLDCWQDGK